MTLKLRYSSVKLGIKNSQMGYLLFIANIGFDYIASKLPFYRDNSVKNNIHISLIICKLALAIATIIN